MATLIKNTYMTKFNEAVKAEVEGTVSASTDYAFQIKDKHWKYAIVATASNAGNITFKAGDSPLAGGDLIVPVKVGTNVIAVEDALVKINKPYDVDSSNKGLLDVVLFSSDVALTNVMIIKLP
jgi:hypothetical protein